nr:ribonuclease H-like domain-containing protein [Tanacetum cinerariifolium]
MSANDKFGLGYGDYRYGSILSYENEVLLSVFMNKECDLENTLVNDRYAEGMHTVPPPMTGNYMPSGPDVEINYSKITYGPKQTSVGESDSKPVEYASSDSDSSVEPSTSVLEPVDDLHKVLKDKGIVDSGCSKHMTGNKAHLNKVLFTDTGYLVLSPDFMLPDENQVLLKIPRQHNMFSFNLQNIDPSRDLSCLFVKALIDESNKWHRRLGYVNFKNLNKLVKGNLVRGLPSKILKMTTPMLLFKKESNTRPLIKREYSNARTPQQNGVAERKNKTLTEAARTITNLLNVVSAPVSVVGPLRALNNDEPSYPDDHSMPHIEEIYASPSAGIFINSSYADEGVSAFLYGTIDEELYVTQPPGFVDPKFPNKVKQKEDGIFISQDKYVAEILKKFDFLSVKTASTPIETQKPLVKDEEAADVDVHLCSDYAGANLDRKSTTEGCQFLGRRLISWQCKQQTIMATSTTEVEYVAAAHCSALPKGRLLKVTTAKQSKEFASPKQTALGKDESNPLIVDSLLKTILSSMHHVIEMKHWLFQSKRLLFWSTTEVETVNDEVRVQALIDANRVTIKESSICRTLKLDDEEGISCLANDEIFTCLPNMGFEKISDKLTFYKAFFSPQ